MAAAQSRTVLPATPAVKSGVATAPTHRGARRETRLDFHGIHARPAGGAPDRPRPACGPFRPGPRRDGAARRAALGGGPGRPVDAGRQPRQMAPRARAVVLRDAGAEAR